MKGSGLEVGRAGSASVIKALTALSLALAILFSSPLAFAAPGIQLIMVEETGCRFCRQWEADIGRNYSQSPEGRFAPLKRVKREARDLKGLKPVIYTPTFIVMRNGEEMGRVTGYPGKDYFWPELDAILSSVGYMRGL